MTTITTNTTSTISTTNRIAGFFIAVWDGLVALGGANAKVREMEYLSSLSDEALAERGLRRDDIVEYVFRSYLF